MCEEKYKLLQTLFEKDTQDAINECKRIILDSTNLKSYDDYISKYINSSQNSLCQKDFDQNKLTIHCIDCAKYNNSYICLKCFLNGNHQGHRYTINKSPIFKCDCGDKTKMKCTGFCKDHKEINQDIINSDKTIHDNPKSELIDIIFKAAFLALFNPKIQNTSIISDFIISFIKFSDHFRQLTIEFLANELDFENIMLHIFDYNLQFNESLSKICKYLVNDIDFINFFSIIS